MVSYTFEKIGTHWTIDLPTKDKIIEKIQNRIDDFENTYSRFKKNSFLNKISTNTGKFEIPDDAKPLFDIYYNLYKLTNGKFTPMIGKLLVDSGYDAQYSFQPKNLSQPQTLKDTMDYSYPTLTIKKPAQLDFGAAGKGYIVDIIANIIKKDEIKDFTIDAGGDIYHFGSKKLKVGLEHPNDLKKVIGVTEISNGSICGSSGNRRRWNNSHHIIDPDKLSPVKEISAVWVKSKSAIVADAISTCLFFTDPDILKKSYDFEYLILKSDMSIDKSDGFKAEIFYA